MKAFKNLKIISYMIINSGRNKAICGKAINRAAHTIIANQKGMIPMNISLMGHPPKYP